MSSKTLASYNTGVNAFVYFCSLYGITFHTGEWVGSEEVLVHYTCYLADVKSLAHVTIKLYLAGLRNYCITHAMDYPFEKPNGQQMLQLKLVLRGIKKSRVPKQLRRQPITAVIMIRLFNALNGTQFGVYEDILFKAVLSLAFFGFMRCGEFTTQGTHFDPEFNVCLGDLILGTNEAKLILKTSKTDPFRLGVTIPFFKQDSVLCPISALQGFMKLRASFASNPALPLFLFHDFTHLTRRKFITMLHETCKSSGIACSGFYGHSFRIGAATTCAKMGVADHLIQTLGRWSSNCYKTYVHVSDNSIKEAQRKMSKIE